MTRGPGPTLYGLFAVMAAFAAAAVLFGVSAQVILVNLLIFAALAYSINFITGMTGYVSFGHVAFMAIGSYSLAVLVSGYSASPFEGVALGAVLGLLFALGIGLVTLRFRGVYFAISSLVLALAGYNIVLQFPQFGPGGELIFNIPFRPLTVYFTIWGIVMAEIVLTYFINRGKIGYGIRAIKSEEDAAAAAGVNSMRLKLYVFMLSGLFAGAAGAVNAWSNFGVNASSAFDLTFSLQMLAMIIVGGMGTSIGPLLGASIVYLLYYELLTVPRIQIGSFAVQIQGAQFLIVGAAVIVIALFVPDGIIGIIRRKYVKLRPVVE
ncbi:MAG: branched-chain amino acid ABC transporter permease [Thaumarchaeota archaeon]|nr:branched-chain amino acid ABC transporter permease [Nitrososphaerota archaeon]